MPCMMYMIYASCIYEKCTCKPAWKLKKKVKFRIVVIPGTEGENQDSTISKEHTGASDVMMFLTKS